jgi:hypothetical protein
MNTLITLGIVSIVTIGSGFSPPTQAWSAPIPSLVAISFATPISAEDFSFLIHFNPSDVQAYSGRAIVRAGLGDKKGALKDLRNVERLYVIASSAETNPPLRDFYQEMLKETRSLLRKLQR